MEDARFARTVPIEQVEPQRRSKTAPLRIVTTLEMPARPPRPSPAATTVDMPAVPPR